MLKRPLHDDQKDENKLITIYSNCRSNEPQEKF